MLNKSTSAYDPVRTFEVQTRDIVYLEGPGGSWPARIYQPQGSGPFPALLDVHGGAWNRSSYLANESMDQVLAASGIVVVAIEFRLAPDHPYPAQVTDVNYGIRWLKAHAHEFDADPDSVGALGASSGGHTLMLNALRPHDSRYTAIPLPDGNDVDATLRYVLACWPVLDSYARYLYAKEAGQDRLATSTEAYFLTEDAMQEGSPQLVLSRGEKVHLPPTLIIQGTNDDNIPLSIPQKFVPSFRDAGGHIELEMFPGLPHAFGNMPGPDADRALELMKGFVARQLIGSMEKV